MRLTHTHIHTTIQVEVLIAVAVVGTRTAAGVVAAPVNNRASVFALLALGLLSSWSRGSGSHRNDDHLRRRCLLLSGCELGVRGIGVEERALSAFEALACARRVVLADRLPKTQSQNALLAAATNKRPTNRVQRRRFRLVDMTERAGSAFGALAFVVKPTSRCHLRVKKRQTSSRTSIEIIVVVFF